MANLKNKDTLREKILGDKAVRREVTRRSHYWFFCVFLGHYIQYEVSLFQQEMFRLTEDRKHKLVAVMAFRGSGKSTIMNLSYALWSVLGVQQKKFVLMISKTQSQAKMHFFNIRDELKQNDLLSKDLGPFETDDVTWGINSLVLPKMGARIMMASREQAVRGIRFGQYRPDLIICDDLEDSTSVQSKADSDTAYEWFVSEVMPAGDVGTKVVVLGNLLGKDCLLMRLKKGIDQKEIDGVFKAYPLVDDNEKALWPSRFSMRSDIKRLEKSIGDESTWEREYLLVIGSSTVIQVISFAERDCPSCRTHNEIKNKSARSHSTSTLGMSGYVISVPVIEDDFKTVIVPYREYLKGKGLQ